MKFRKVLLGGAVLLAVFAVQIDAHAGILTETKPYVAGSTGVTVSGPVTVNEAGGAVDCASGQGGACFKLTVAKPGDAFTVTAKDRVSGTVTFFMGFDVDGDGCVACKNGSALGNDGDAFWQGSDSVTGRVPQGIRESPTLFVFVRVATVNTGDLGTTGTLTIRQTDCDPARGCQTGDDPNMGQICTGGSAGGPAGDCQHVMYPYAGH